MVSAPVVRDRNSAFLDERIELHAVLSSPLFQRAPNLSKILAYICEQYFSGKASDLKEYNIAVDALGRASGFDPQVDAIVRVDLHLLRKRLEVFYSQDNRSRRLRIVLPLGQYTPDFVRREGAQPIDGRTPTPELPRRDQIEHATLPKAPLGEPVAIVTTSDGNRPGLGRRTMVQHAETWSRSHIILLVAVSCCLLGLTIGAGGTLVLYGHRIFMWSAPGAHVPRKAINAEILPRIWFDTVPDFEDQAIRIRCGSNQDYVDASGLRWSMDRYYSGGTPFHRNITQIFRAADPTLYSTGRQGIFQYNVPVPPGTYEVRLLFAETAPGIEDGVRQNSFDVGPAISETLDIASDAGAERSATMKVYPNVQPGADGKISIHFWSSDAFLNALEIVPEINGKPDAIRISTLPRVFRDSAGRHWLSDRYFLGGRNINHLGAMSHDDSLLFSHERYGSFSYAIPVARGFSYQLTLYMAERYWGLQNSGPGGIGSRVFNVRCNGLGLLEDFDLLKIANSLTGVAVRFSHLQPDSDGKLSLDFVPVTNYAVLNALEVTAE